MAGGTFIEIRRLSPELCDDYLRFFDKTPHDDNRDDYYACHAGRMYLEPLRALYPPDERVKSVYCFVVAPEWRRHGVAAALLERVCEDARAEGFDAVEAYPIAQFVSEQADYMGPAALYEGQGFAVLRTLGDRLIVRKALK